MTEAPAPAPSRRRAGCALGCLRWALAAAVAVLVVFVVLQLVFGGDDNGSGAGTVNAGAAESFERGDTSYLDQQHIFVTRLDDGSFVALYDRSSRQQEIGGDCRVRYDDSAGLGTLPQLPGFSGGFVEECEESRTVWRADGAFALGGGYGDLDRFNTRVDSGGDLLIETDERTCTRSLGVPGIPPFETRTCSGIPR
jgi:hypothetical protein